MRDAGIADRLRKYGLNVVEVAGWKTRGSDTFNPRGSVDHHTAGPATGNAPSLGICINGRSGLPGPLCNVFIARDNTCYVVAAGRANHAGLGGWRGLSGNSSVYGIERENVGYGDREPWREDQTDTAARAHAALMESKDPSLVCMHKEWAPTRKIDAHTLTGDELRNRVMHHMGQSPTPPTPPPTSTTPSDGLLKVGSRGQAVVEWQRLLIGASLLPTGADDGVFGPNTDAATRAFQRALGVTADGVVGPATRAAVERLLAYLAALAMATPAPRFPGTMRKGAVSNSVRQFQAKLRDRGWRIVADGNFGPATDAIVRKFQAEKGLAVDGVVGPATWNAIFTAPL